MQDGIDVIGTIAEVPPDAHDAIPVPLDGWHVNVTAERMAARPEWQPFRVLPTRMRRVWAGDDPLNPQMTVALRFADADEAAVLGASSG
ncbi:hypothetical protein [Brevundimonas sp.]|uniref:hypothetical protein n=1 Tax=Brevundimonas sp. TaxID=1871086 RepID=UPI002ABA08FB|nr:hypothetical protein [Brevundimonas sp.]MDZ4363228.1 hypothetical protein [Brevundimonas sp.]